METDEMIWVENNGTCSLTSGKESVACHHHQTSNPLCFGTHGSSEWPCKDQSIVLVNKQEYAIWRLTR